MLLTAARPSKRSQLPHGSTDIIGKQKLVPASTGGWDAKNPLPSMPPKNAVVLDNFFPQTTWVEFRNGYVLQAATGTGLPVETVMPYHGTTTDLLFAASDDAIFDVTARSNVIHEVLGGFGSARFQFVNVATSGGNFLWCCNGVDDPVYFDGTNWNTANITGINASDIDYVNLFKKRLFFCFNNSTAFGYLDVDSIQGTGTTFELGGYMNLGGYLVAMATWTIDAGDGPDDYAVFITSRGQVIVFKGSDPNTASDWLLVGIFNMGEPIGRRCFYKVGADVAIICIDGVVPLSKSLIFERAAVVKISLTENIQLVMNQSAAAYRNNFGWQLLSYPKGNRVILNVPVTENVMQQQYVMNALNGAWCRYTGWNFSCFELFLDRVYAGGNDGNVYLTHESGTDNGTAITYTMETAYNYLGQGPTNKRFTQCQPLMSTSSNIFPAIGLNLDFKDNAILSTQSSVITPTALWDAATWDVAVWPTENTFQNPWITVTGIGQAVSIKTQITIAAGSSGSACIWGQGTWGTNTWGSSLASSPEVTLQLHNFNLVYEPLTAFV